MFGIAGDTTAAIAQNQGQVNLIRWGSGLFDQASGQNPTLGARLDISRNGEKWWIAVGQLINGVDREAG